jgi:Methyltransferase domain
MAVPVEVEHCWPIGHYYSPVPDTRELAREPARSRVWPPAPKPMVGIDWREVDQLSLLREDLAPQEHLALPARSTGRRVEYHSGNEFFGLADAWTLQAMLQHVRPTRIIEVGGGWSSLVTAHVNRERFDGELRFTCVEPYPAAFLTEQVDGLTELICAPVQELPVELFMTLQSGDVLFIDTSHVAKTGGDVQFLYHEVVPRLDPGVIVHIHDIFLPWDYPEDWVLGGRGWNEQYLVRSFLTFNDSFEVMLGVGWLCLSHPAELAAAIPGFDPTRDGGASLWIRRKR